MKVNYTNQIRVFLEETDTLLDIRYDNTKGLTHSVKTHEAKMYKKIPHIDGSEVLDELPPFFLDKDCIQKMIIELIYKDRRGTLKDGMKI
tara:strand:+ start:351 stop:620 length:270 start_codon:yes stop_codon:yes gene_type:complete